MKNEMNIDGQIWVRKDTPATGGFGRMYRHKPTGRIYEKHENKAHPDGVYRCDQYGGFLIEPVMVEYGNDFEKIVPSTPPGIVKMNASQIWTIRDTDGREFSIGDNVRSINYPMWGTYFIEKFEWNSDHWLVRYVNGNGCDNVKCIEKIEKLPSISPLEAAIQEKDIWKAIRLLSDKIK